MERQYLKELVLENKDIIYQNEFFNSLKSTNQRISEIVVDGLFHDTIYNI